MVSVPGGLVAAGGTFRDSAVRELREEAGVQVRPSELQKVFAHNHFGTCKDCNMAQRVVYRTIFKGPAAPRVAGPDRSNSWEVDLKWNGSGLTRPSAGKATGHYWATAEELRAMHQLGACQMFFPGGRGDLEMFRAFEVSLPLHQPQPTGIVKRARSW
jgi:hypothetical protein